jgi:hypothetical protein
MPDTQARARITSTLSAVVHRADGTVEDLGVISTTEVEPEEAPLRRLLSKLKGARHVSR